MIPELDRSHGVVLRQLLVALARPVRIAAADTSGRVDCYELDEAAFQIKYSGKRLTPWRFTYDQAQWDELRSLRESHQIVWAFFVCGVDGVVGLSFEEIESVLDVGTAGVGWIRAGRGRNKMYRLAGARGELPNARARGVEPFVTALALARRLAGAS